MTTSKGLAARAAGAILGGMAWIPVRLGVSVSFSFEFLALDYVTWNKLMVVPLALMLVAVLGMLGSARTKTARIGSGMTAGGLVGMLTGVVVEFFVFGGLAGDREGAIAGWTIYLVGLAVHVIGLLVVAAAIRGTVLGWLALLIAILHLGWLPAGMLDNGLLLIADQVAIGAGWLALGLIGWRSHRTARLQSP